MRVADLALILVVIIAVTFIQKSFPLIIFQSHKDNKLLLFMIEQLTPVFMIALVVYMLRTKWLVFPYVNFIPLCSAIVTGIIHVLLRQPFLSIFLGLGFFSILKFLVL